MEGWADGLADLPRVESGYKDKKSRELFFFLAVACPERAESLERPPPEAPAMIQLTIQGSCAEYAGASASGTARATRAERCRSSQDSSILFPKPPPAAFRAPCLPAFRAKSRRDGLERTLHGPRNGVLRQCNAVNWRLI